MVLSISKGLDIKISLILSENKDWLCKYTFHIFSEGNISLGHLVKWGRGGIISAYSWLWIYAQRLILMMLRHYIWCQGSKEGKPYVSHMHQSLPLQSRIDLHFQVLRFEINTTFSLKPNFLVMISVKYGIRQAI